MLTTIVSMCVSHFTMSNVYSISWIVSLFVVTCSTSLSKSENMPSDIDIATYSAVNSAAGSKIQLSCTSSSVDDVLWAYSNTSDGQVHDVYSHGAIVNGYRGRFFFKNTSANGKTHYLIISRAECRDAGLYWCIERNGIGSHHMFLVSVIDTRQPMTHTDSGAAGGTDYTHALLANVKIDSVIDSVPLPIHNDTSAEINSCLTSNVITFFVTCAFFAVMIGIAVVVWWMLYRKTREVQPREGTSDEQRGLTNAGGLPHVDSFVSQSPEITEANEKLRGMGTHNIVIDDGMTASDDDSVLKM